MHDQCQLHTSALATLKADMKYTCKTLDNINHTLETLIPLITDTKLIAQDVKILKSENQELKSSLKDKVDIKTLKIWVGIATAGSGGGVAALLGAFS
jgi:cell shape-determining protein MreC